MTSKSTITRERLEKIKSWRETYGAGSNVMLPAEEAEELSRMALAAMDSEPVAYAWVSRSGKKHLTRCEPEQWRDAVIVTPLYRHAQPAPVVPSFEEWLSAINRKPLGWVKDAMREAYDACRSAMLQAENPDAWWQGLYGEIKGRGQRSTRDFTPDLGMSTEDIIDAINKRHVSDAGNSPVIGIDPASGPDRTVEVRYVAPPSYVMVPKEPTEAHLNSIAMRYRHDFYLLNDAQKDSALATARQMYEECSGQGFYMLPAAPQEVNNG